MNKLKAGLLFTLVIVLASSASAQLTPGNTNKFLSNRSFTNDRPQPLLVEQAFPYYVSAVSPTQLRITWEISPGHYLYRQQFHFYLLDPGTQAQRPVDFTLPAGKPLTDEFFGAVEVYYDRISVDINFDQAPESSDFLQIQFQGCADWGFCYPPQSDQYAIGL